MLPGLQMRLKPKHTNVTARTPVLQIPAPAPTIGDIVEGSNQQLLKAENLMKLKIKEPFPLQTLMAPAIVKGRFDAI